MAVKTGPAQAMNKALIPPEESTWQKYSPHFELPLASATSLFLHGTIIGMHSFGASAPIKDLLKKFGFTPERVMEAATAQLAGSKRA